MLRGNTNAERFINFFMERIGNPFGVCGLGGNIRAESNFKTTNMENYYEKKLGMNDDIYTMSVDNGDYSADKFIRDCVGYGIAQWTYWSRKKALLEYARKCGKSIGDEEMQYEHLYNELKGYNLIEPLKNAKSIREASDIILVDFENPADQSESMKIRRAGYGQELYDQYINKEEVVMKVTAQDYLAVWRSWLGFSEKNGKFRQIIDLYNSVKPLPKGYAVQYDDEWCDTTVSAAAIKANCVDLIGRECGCQRHIDIFKELGIWIEDGTITPEPGYIILYNWDTRVQPNDGYADHIGVVESVSNGQITCIEGNKGQAVARRVLSVGNGQIRGYASPKFAKISEPTATPFVPPTVTEINPTDDGVITKEVAYYGTVNTGCLNVRTFAGSNNPKLKSYPTIKQGTKVGICDVVKDKDGDPWYYIKISGDKGDKYGFVSAPYITKLENSVPNTNSDGALNKQPKWVGVVTASALNVRTWAGTNNPRMASYPALYKGNMIDVCDTVTATDGSVWYYVRIEGRVFGFIHSAYVARV